MQIKTATCSVLFCLDFLLWHLIYSICIQNLASLASAFSEISLGHQKFKMGHTTQTTPPLRVIYQPYSWNDILDIAYLCTKFDHSSFRHSIGMVGAYRNLNGSRDLTSPPDPHDHSQNVQYLIFLKIYPGLDIRITLIGPALANWPYYAETRIAYAAVAPSLLPTTADHMTLYTHRRSKVSRFSSKVGALDTSVRVRPMSHLGADF